MSERPNRLTRSEPDRGALLRCYFERKSAREMAQTLGVSEDAAQKRVSRAVEHLVPIRTGGNRISNTRFILAGPCRFRQ